MQQLQQLSAQLQRLTAAVQQAAPPVTQPSRSPQQAWANSVQQQAKQAADALQQHVTAALSGGAHPGALLLPHHAPFTHAGVLPRWSNYVSIAFVAAVVTVVRLTTLPQRKGIARPPQQTPNPVSVCYTARAHTQTGTLSGTSFSA